VGSEYEVKVTAVSPAGYGETAMISRIMINYLNGSPTSYPGKRNHLLEFTTVKLYEQLRIKAVTYYIKFKD
jgi:hypothetical protein